MPVTFTVEIPDDLAQILGGDTRDLSRAALVALAVEAYRARRLSDSEFRRILGLTRFEADAVLKAHGVWLDYTVDDFHREEKASRPIGQR